MTLTWLDWIKVITVPLLIALVSLLSNAHVWLPPQWRKEKWARPAPKQG